MRSPLLLSTCALLATVACGGSSDASDASVSGESTGGNMQTGTGGSGGGAEGTGGNGGTAGANTGGTSGGDSGAGTTGTSGGAMGAATGDAGVEITCDPRLLRCKIAETPCPQGQVHEIIDACYGPCVPIMECPCDGPDACPHSESYTCWNNTKHCGDYVN